MKATFITPTWETIKDLAYRLRDADREEMRVASGGLTTIDGLYQSVAVSDFCRALCIDGRPEVIFGTGEGNEPGRVLWMVGTDAIKANGLAICKLARVIVKALLDSHGHLYNYAKADNEVHIRWLKFLGAELSEATVNINGAAFRRFDIYRKEEHRV